jgi:hypothetical protein
MNLTRTRIVTAAGVAVATALAIGIGWSLASTGGEPLAGDVATTPTAATPAPAAPTPGQGEPTPGSAGGSGAPGGSDGPGQGAPGQGAPGGQEGSGGQPEAGPRIEYFRVGQEPLCPRGTTQNPIDGRPVTLQWRVIGATQVSMSIDGPGVYDVYPAESSASFDFGCGGNDGDIEEHTYQLTAVADGVTVTETLVVTARVYEITQV